MYSSKYHNLLLLIFILLPISKIVCSAAKLKSHSELENCFIANNLRVFDTNQDTLIGLTNLTNCGTAYLTTKEHIFGGIYDHNKILNKNIQTSCAGNKVLCCIFLEEDLMPQKHQPNISLNGYTRKYRVARIECMFDIVQK
jgi:hypothetical protein